MKTPGTELPRRTGLARLIVGGLVAAGFALAAVPSAMADNDKWNNNQGTYWNNQGNNKHGNNWNNGHGNNGHGNNWNKGHASNWNNGHGNKHWKHPNQGGHQQGYYYAPPPPVYYYQPAPVYRRPSISIIFPFNIH